MNPSHRSVVGSVASEGGLCHPSPCHNGGSCESHDGVFTCYCPQGFAGSLCQHDLTKSRDRIPRFELNMSYMIVTFV